MKKKMKFLSVMLLGMSLVGCGGQNEQPTPPQVEEVAGQELSIGVMGAVDAVPLVIAQEKGFFDNAGVKVNVEIFKSAKDRDAALQAGELDGVLGDQVAIAIYQNAGIDMKITGSTDGQFSFVAGANSGIDTMKDAVGKKIAISENTVIEYTLDKMLEAQGVNPADVEKVAVPPMPTRLEMLNAGEVDAALMPNPFSDAAVATGSKIIDKVDSTGNYISIIAFEKGAIDKKAAEIKGFYEGYNEAVKYLNATDIKEYEDVIITTVGYPDTMKGQIILPTFRENVLPTAEQIDEVFEWSRSKGILTKDITGQDVLSEVGIK